MTTSIETRVSAARHAVRTHDQLHRVEALGAQFETGPDGSPLDAAGWLAWHTEQYRPALIEWQTAMALLALELGDEFPGRHPHQFRPVCEQILTRADAAAAKAALVHRPDEPNDDARAIALRAIGGERKATRAEQMRARGLSDREIARRIGVGLATVRTWFHLQDELLLTDETGRELVRSQ